MRQLPKAIPELDGGLFLPRPVVDLLESVLLEHDAALRQRPEPALGLSVLAELQQLLRMTGPRPFLPCAREQLGLVDPSEQTLARNLMRG